MPIQQVKGQPYTTYVISGTTSPANYAQQFAQLATQQKYEQLRMAEQAAQLEYQAEQQQRAMGMKSYQEELDASRKDQIRNEQQLEAVRKEIRATQGKMAELGIKAQPSTSVSTSVGGGSTRAPKSRTEQIDAQLRKLYTEAVNFREAQAKAKEDQATLGKSDSEVFNQAKATIDQAQAGIDSAEAKILALKNEKLAIESDPSLDVIDSGGGVGGTRTTTRVTPGKDTSQARGDYQSILDDLLAREQELQAYTPQQISQPTLPPQEEYLNKVRRIAQEQLGVKPSRMQRIPAPQGIPTQNEKMRNYLLSLLPPTPPTQTEQPIQTEPQFTFSSELGKQTPAEQSIQQPSRVVAESGGQGAVTRLGGLNVGPPRLNVTEEQRKSRLIQDLNALGATPEEIKRIVVAQLYPQPEPQFAFSSTMGKQIPIQPKPQFTFSSELGQQTPVPSEPQFTFSSELGQQTPIPSEPQFTFSSELGKQTPISYDQSYSEPILNFLGEVQKQESLSNEKPKDLTYSKNAGRFIERNPKLDFSSELVSQYPQFIFDQSYSEPILNFSSQLGKQEPQFTFSSELGKQTPIQPRPTIQDITNLETDIEDPSIRSKTIVTPQRQLELDMIGAQPTPSQQVIPAPQQQTLDTMQSPTTSKPDMLSERKMKRVVRDIERLNKARTYPSDDIEKLLNSRNPPEHIKLAISLYNPSRYESAEKLDDILTNAIAEIKRQYANDPQKMEEAVSFILALHFLKRG